MAGYSVMGAISVSTWELALLYALFLWYVGHLTLTGRRRHAAALLVVGAGLSFMAFGGLLLG